MMSVLSVTEIIIGISVVILILYDIFAVLKWGIDQTISAILLKRAHEYPVIPFALGFLFGHLFFSQC